VNDAWNPPESDDGAWGGPGDDGPGDGGLPAARVFEPVTLLRLGWAVLKEQPAMVVTGGLAVLVVQVAPSLLGVPLDMITAALLADESGSNPLEGIWGAVLSLFATPFSLLFAAGCFTASANWVTREESDIMAVFTSFVPALKLLLATIAYMFVLLPLFVALFAPIGGGVYLLTQGGTLSAMLLFAVALGMAAVVIWVQLGLVFVQVAAAVDGMGPVEALQASLRAASGARLVLFVTLFVWSAVTMIACCAGFLPMIPLMGMYYASFATAWLLHSRPAARTRRWAFVQRNGFGALYEG